MTNFLLNSSDEDPMLTKTPFRVDRHYYSMACWLSQRRLEIPDDDMLPPTGLMVYAAGAPIACGFLHITDSNLGMIGNFASDPNAPNEFRGAAVDFLIDELIDTAKIFDVKMVSMACKSDRLAQRLKDRGFAAIESGLTHYGREVECQQQVL